MKISKVCIILTFSWGCSFLFAQNKQVIYDFIETPQALLLNPGMETSFKWHAGVPLISGLSFQAGSSGVTVNDLFADDGIDINTKIRERAIFGQSPRDQLSGSYQIELLSGGFRGKNRPENFYSFGLYNEGDAIGYWFRDLAILAVDGNADNLGRRFDLSDLNTRGEIVNVYHFGVNKVVSNKLTVGVRAKIYSSVINFNSTKNKGFFVTNEGENNLLVNTFDGELEMRTSGLQELKDILEDDTIDSGAGISSVLTRRLLFGGNLGLGFDVGFTYNLNKQTVVTGSLLDLGFIYHTKDVESYTLKGNASFEGVEIILPGAALNPGEDFYQNLIDDLEEALPFDTNRKNYLTFRPTKLNASIRYNFGKELKPRGADDCNCDYRVGSNTSRTSYTNSLGGQLFAINRPRGPQVALTAFYQRRFGNAFSVKTTYTADKFSFANIGLGFNVQAGPVNIYAAADNLLSYGNVADTHYLSFQLGLNIISWGNKK